MVEGSELFLDTCVVVDRAHSRREFPGTSHDAARWAAASAVATDEPEVLLSV